MHTVSEATDVTELVELATRARSAAARFPGSANQLENLALEVEVEIEDILWPEFLQSQGLDREKVKNQSEDDGARLDKAWNALLQDDWGIFV